jgi:hypothetical protein
MTAWPRYQSHKQVDALKIEAVEHQAGPSIKLVFAEGFDPVTLLPEMYARYMPQRHDFYVRYDDNYESISPKKAFEEGYTLIPPQKSSPKKRK